MGRPSETSAACSAWDNSGCTGTPYCQPRCPRFFDGEGDPLLVTPFEDDDFEALVSMYEGLAPENRTSSLPPKTREETVEWLETLTDRGWNLVARDGARVVGHVGVTPVADGELEFVVFVADDHQGRGIGTELVEQLIAYAAARGHDALRLSVERSNERAISVYENVCFEVAEERMATIVMELSLAEPIADDVQRPPADR
ncbi:GNAT family N-acetyltransferase [Halobacterium wangiae]|uniref:GNAT family N-acetyltransferase n=1 Tax=Halobacterium wangiae TaxID=2902623 RepID=UPI001E4A667B|nr:GNAT family N-acetyltransferase [Halobacterium wangiae]